MASHEPAENIELVTSVRRGRSVIVAPPVEPISGYIRAVPETEILRSFAKSRPHEYAVDPDTIENFVQLPDRAYIAVLITCDQPEEVFSFLKAKEVWAEVIESGESKTIRALLDLPNLIHICSPIRYSGLKIVEEEVPETFPKISTPFRTEIGKLEAQVLPDEIAEQIAALPKHSLTPIEVFLQTPEEKAELKINLRALGLWVRSGNGTSTNMQAMVNSHTVRYLTTFSEIESLRLAKPATFHEESDLSS